tara:strand:- start:319 stop:786 length:468 start_codon:yes stop_codon:yes gene_type:complete
MGEQLANTIEGVKCNSITKVSDPRGDLFHVVKETELLRNIKEIYCSSIYRNEIKAWKKHLKMTQYLVVPVGTVKFILYDDRENSSTYKRIDELIIGEQQYSRLIIPPNIWYGFQSKSMYTSLIINTPDLAYDPNETERLPLDQTHIPYRWTINDD